MAKYFYVMIYKCSVETYWYSNFVGHVFLVRNDLHNRSKYQLADGISWIDKKDTKKVEVEVVEK